MLVTTSRYCPIHVRELAKAIAIVFSGEYVARGKKSVDSLVCEARRKGHSRICLVFIDAPRLMFITVNEVGDWDWVDDVIAIKKADFSLNGLWACGFVEGKDAEKLCSLLDFDGNKKAEEDAVVIAENGKIKFSCRGSRFELEIGYERKMQNKD